MNYLEQLKLEVDAKQPVNKIEEWHSGYYTSASGDAAIGEWTGDNATFNYNGTYFEVAFGAGNADIVSSTYSCSEGQHVSMDTLWRFPSPDDAYIEFLSGGVLESTQHVGYSAPGTRLYTQAVVPSGVDEVRIRVEHNDATEFTSELEAASLTIEDLEQFSGATAEQASPVYNLFPNPRGEKGTYGWSTPAEGSSVALRPVVGPTAVGYWFIFTAVNDGATASHYYTIPFPANAGEYHTFGFKKNAFASVPNPFPEEGLFEYLDADFEVIGDNTGLGTAVLSASSLMYFIESNNAAPAGTEYVRWTFEHGGNSHLKTDVDPIELTNITFFPHDGTAEFPPSLLGHRYFETALTHRWLNVLADATKIDIMREGVSAGTMTASVKGTDLDPLVSSYIRPGRAVRLCLNSGECLFEGTTTDTDVTYGLEPEDTVVSLVASNNSSKASQVRELRGAETIDELVHLFEGKGIPWNVNGYGGQSDDVFTPVALNDNASLLDQVEVTRESSLGYAWVDRTNVVNVYDSAQMPHESATPSIAALFDDTSYSAINVGFDDDTLINTVVVEYLRFDPTTEKTQQVTYGPYTDEASIEEWGTRTARFTMQSGTEDPVAIESFANSVLAANATPEVRPRSLTVPLNTQERIDDYATVDLYDFVGVQYAPLDNNFFVTAVSHSIAPKSWLMDLGFTTSGTVQAPTFTPAPTYKGEVGNQTINGDLSVTGDVTLSGTLSGLSTPTADDEAANKQYVDGRGGGVIDHETFADGGSGWFVFTTSADDVVHTLVLDKPPDTDVLVMASANIRFDTLGGNGRYFFRLNIAGNTGTPLEYQAGGRRHGVSPSEAAVVNDGLTTVTIDLVVNIPAGTVQGDIESLGMHAVAFLL